MGGIPEFCKLAAALAFGKGSAALQEGRNATIQCLSGTGSLRVSSNDHIGAAACTQHRGRRRLRAPCVNQRLTGYVAAHPNAVSLSTDL